MYLCVQHVKESADGRKLEHGLALCISLTVSLIYIDVSRYLGLTPSLAR